MTPSLELQTLHLMTDAARLKIGKNDEYVALLNAHYEACKMELDAMLKERVNPEIQRFLAAIPIEQYIAELYRIEAEVQIEDANSFATQALVDMHILKLEMMRAKLLRIINETRTAIETVKFELGQISIWWKGASLGENAGKTESETVNEFYPANRMLSQWKIVADRAGKTFELLSDQIPSLQGLAKRRGEATM